MANYQFLIATGMITVDTSSLLTDVQNEYLTALGANLNLAASSPQGTLIAGETASRAWVMRNNAEVANQINPNLAVGNFLDAICALMDISRGTNQSTVVANAKFDGNSGTIIPIGSRVQTSNGDIFVTQSQVTIPSGGTIRANIQSQAFGAIPAPNQTLTILDNVIGWGDCIIDGTSTVTLGTLQLNDAQLRIARTQRLAYQGVSSSIAVLASLGNVANIGSAMIVENNTGSTGAVNGVTFTLPRALWACVNGGTDQDVANALYAAHNSGCPWDYGTSSGTPVSSPNGVAVQDPLTSLTYYVKFTRPALYDCYVNITVHQNNTQSTPIQSVQQALMNYASGLEDGEPGLVVGANVSAYEMAGAVARQLPGMYVKSCAIACVTAGGTAPVYPGGYSQEFLPGPFGLAVLAPGRITVTVV